MHTFVVSFYQNWSQLPIIQPVSHRDLLNLFYTKMSQGQCKNRDTRINKNTHPSHHTKKKEHHHHHCQTQQHSCATYKRVHLRRLHIHILCTPQEEEASPQTRGQEKGARSSAPARCTKGCALRQRFRRDYNAAVSPPSVLLRHSSLSFLLYSCCTQRCSQRMCTHGHMCASALCETRVSAST